MTRSAAAARLNLSKSTVLLVQSNAAELDITGQIFIGFGVKGIRKCLTIADAESQVGREVFDLIVLDIQDDGTLDFVKRLRRLEDGPNRLAPVLAVSGHTPSSLVARARDAGTNIVVAKPVTPQILLDRVMWLAREERKFVESDGYVGPDRRHKAYGPPPGMTGRRHDDLPAEVGAAVGPDLSQDAIDALLSPKRVAA